MIADVAHAGTALPSYSSGTKLVVSMPVGYLVRSGPRSCGPDWDLLLRRRAFHYF